ncbi:MAG: response regulator [FCB group bacterium]|nr:response regulator [FCB group bacterium]
MGKTLKILLVDDDKALVKTLTMFLRYEGHEVEATTNPLEAFEIAGRSTFDLIIADYFMNQMDGIELVDKCREKQFDLQAILITGHWDKLNEAGDICAKFKAILPKPLDIDQLVEELNSVKSVQ